MQIISGSPFPAGLIVVCSADLSRYNESNDCISHVIAPEGSRWVRMQGTSIGFARNLALRQYLAPQHKWVWYIDDDQTFASDNLIRLLGRNVDIVQPLVSIRKPPFVSMAQRNDSEGKPYTIPWEEHFGDNDLLECDAVGAGGMLIKRKVLDAIGDPWFRVGQLDVEQLQEDHWFCTEAKRLGFRIWTDLACAHGHMNTHAVVPIRDENGVWHIHLDLGMGVVLKLPTMADEIALQI